MLQASGDKSGIVFIWEIARSICLRKFEWSRGLIYSKLIP